MISSRFRLPSSAKNQQFVSDDKSANSGTRGHFVQGKRSNFRTKKSPNQSWQVPCLKTCDIDKWLCYVALENSGPSPNMPLPWPQVAPMHLSRHRGGFFHFFSASSFVGSCDQTMTAPWFGCHHPLEARTIPGNRV